jgi:defect in organelle trafficking protein DotD
MEAWMRMTRVVVVLIPVALAACAAPVQPVSTTVATPGMPNPEIALQTTMLDVHSEMAELNGIVPPSPSPPATPVVPADLNRVVSFSWNGSLDQAVAKLALSIGYTYFVSAPQNAQPMDVSIDVNSMSVFDIFQMLGNDAGSRATVTVDPLNHQVELAYHA